MAPDETCISQMPTGVNGPTVTVPAAALQHEFDRCENRASQRTLSSFLDLGCLM